MSANTEMMDEWNMERVGMWSSLSRIGRPGNSTLTGIVKSRGNKDKDKCFSSVVAEEGGSCRGSDVAEAAVLTQTLLCSSPQGSSTIPRLQIVWFPSARLSETGMESVVGHQGRAPLTYKAPSTSHPLHNSTKTMSKVKPTVKLVEPWLRAAPSGGPRPDYVWWT